MKVHRYPQAPFFDLEKMMAEQAAIEAKIEAVNRAEVERERLMKEKEMAEMMAAAKEEQEAEMAEMMALEEAEKMAMVAAEKMVAEEVAKEVWIGSVLLAFGAKRSAQGWAKVCFPGLVKTWAAGRRTQFFLLIFTKPGRSLLAEPCMNSRITG